MTLKTPITVAAFVAGLTIASSALAAGDYHTGLVPLSVPGLASDGARPLEGFLWYPTDVTEGSVLAHGNAVWEGIRAIPHADIAGGERPLVVLSHGMYGNARNQAWLAAELTAQGYLVAAISHPGTSTLLREPDDAREMWERPHDISRTIDHILAMDGFGEAVDQDRIFMAGHSLGGFTAMMLAGARYDAVRFDAVCDALPDDLACEILSMWSVGETETDRAMLAQDWSDPRLAGVVVFDLGGAQTFSVDSLAAIETPLLVFGAPVSNSGLNLDVESRALVAALPDGVRYLEPEGLAHFDFLGVCTDRGLGILLEEEPADAMVCENGVDERVREHDMIASEVIAFVEAH